MVFYEEYENKSSDQVVPYRICFPLSLISALRCVERCSSA